MKNSPFDKIRTNGVWVRAQPKKRWTPDQVRGVLRDGLSTALAALCCAAPGGACSDSPQDERSGVRSQLRKKVDPGSSPG